MYMDLEAVDTGTVNRDLTVEECLAELREMFPLTYISLTLTAIWFSCKANPGANCLIVIGPNRHEVFGKTLEEAMAQVRQWRK